MSYPTFPPVGVPQPDQQSKGSWKPRIRKADFGDGYTQRTPDGLNNMPRSYNLKWAALDTTATEWTALLTFFLNQAGYLPFTWQPYDEDEPIQFEWPTLDKEYGEGTLISVTATFNENFDPPTS